MKVYTLHKEVDYNKYTYPVAVKCIMEYLEDHGELHVSTDTIVDLYYAFSEAHACGWRTVDEESLREFAEWLDEYEM